MKKRSNDDIDPQLAREAKAIVAIAFRNGPFENINEEKGGCISNAEIKIMMKYAVDQVYALLWLRDHAPERYEEQIHSGNTFTTKWDEPLADRSLSKDSHPGK